MTYPNPAVIHAVEDRFVALRLQHADPHVRDLNLVWLPTLYVLDKRETIHYRSVNSVPPEELLDVLDLGESHARLKGGKPVEAARLLDRALDRRWDGPHHDELLYWAAIARYFAGKQDEEARDRTWAELKERYPESPWTYRIPYGGEFNVDTRGTETTE